MFGGAHENRRHCNDFVRGFATLVQMLDHRFGDHTHDGTDCGVCDVMHDVQGDDVTIVVRQDKAGDSF